MIIDPKLGMAQIGRTLDNMAKVGTVSCTTQGSLYFRSAEVKISFNHALYLIAQISKIQGAGCGAVSPFHHIAKVCFMTAFGPAQVLEVVEEFLLFHKKTTGGYKHFKN